MAQNLDLGDMVAGNTNQADPGKVEKFCYNDDPANCEKYGGLYQWSEAMNFPSACNTILTGSAGCASTITPTGTYGVEHQGICPSGWHIMNATDWNRVFNGGSQDVFDLRSQISDLTWAGSNNTGFSALPGGWLKSSSTFEKLMTDAIIWMPDETYPDAAKAVFINNAATSLITNSTTKARGLSIRCVKNYN